MSLTAAPLAYSLADATMSDSQDWQPDKYRALLLLQARQLQHDRRLLVRMDWSDLVQETLYKAHRDRAQCRGTTEAERLAWLRTILANTAIDAAIKEGAARRDYKREKTIRGAIEESSARLDVFVSQESSPSERAERQELLLHLADAIDQLPARQREVLIQRDLLSMPIADIAAELKETDSAVANLLYRARGKLRKLMKRFEES